MPITEQHYHCSNIIHEEIHKALLKEYEDLSRKEGEKKIQLKNGVFQHELSGMFIYKFSLPTEPERTLEPEKPYLLSIDGTKVKGNIISVINDKSTTELEFDKNYGKVIPTLDVIIDLKVLIDLIDRRITTIDKEPSNYNVSTAQFLFNPNPDKKVDFLSMKYNHQKRVDHPLLDEQIDAIKAALEQKLTLIWGPPGTGKTVTLQGVIAEFLMNNKRVLFASNTNNAIDNLLKRIISNNPYRIFDDLKEEGKIVRVGSNTDDTVKNTFGLKFVTKEKTEKITNRIDELENSIEDKRANLERIKNTFQKYYYCKSLKPEIERLNEKLDKLEEDNNAEYALSFITNHYESAEIFIRDCISETYQLDGISELSNRIIQNKRKLYGINKNINNIENGIELRKEKLKALNSRYISLKKSLFGSLRHKKEINKLKKESNKVSVEIQENQTLLSTYKQNQQKEIEVESELTGNYIHQKEKLLSFFELTEKKRENIVHCLNLIGLELETESNKHDWVSIGEKYNLLYTNEIKIIELILEFGKIDLKQLKLKKYKKVVDLEKDINDYKNERNELDKKLKNYKEDYENLKELLNMPEDYWNEMRSNKEMLQNKILPVDNEINKLKKFIEKLEKNIVNDAKLVCTTMVKASYDESLSNNYYDILVVDEASMVSLPQLYSVSALIKDRVVICGDHLQLQPIASSSNLNAKKWLSSSYYDFIEHNHRIPDVDFEHIEKVDKLKIFQKELSTQFRMPPTIANLIRPWYQSSGNILKDAYSEKATQNSLDFKDHFLSKNYNVFFIDTSEIETYHSRSSDGSPYNLINAAIVAEVVRELREDIGIPLSKMRCISPYRAQYQLTASLINKFLPNDLSAGAQQIASSVHKIQGGEAPIVFYDLTDGRQGGSTFLIKTIEKHIHNVAISRSKFKLVFIGDKTKATSLANKHPDASILDVLKRLKSSEQTLNINAKPYKQLVFKQYSQSDLMIENTFQLPDLGRNNLIILPSGLYYDSVLNDIEGAEESILIISPFLTKNRWVKMENCITRFIKRTSGKVTILTKPPDNMFGTIENNNPAKKLLNHFLELGITVKTSSKIHTKLVAIDRGTEKAIAYWGSLNPLSFNQTDEINTRIADKVFTEQLVHMSMIGNIIPYKKSSYNRAQIPINEKEIALKLLKDLRWTLAGFYHRPIFAICSNETIKLIIKNLPKSRNDYRQIPQFNNRNFVLWNHLEEIEKIIQSLRDYYKTKNSQTSLFFDE